MKCVNCGAAKSASSQVACLYCESMFDQRVQEADLDGFHLMLRALEITDTDIFKADIVGQFRKKFTAGQVRKLLSTFNTDTYRLVAAEHLVPGIITSTE